MNIAPRTMVVRNPYKRRAPPEDVLLRETVDTLVTTWWSVDIQKTRAPGHATEIARRAAAAGVDVVAACGHDGTVSELSKG